MLTWREQRDLVHYAEQLAKAVKARASHPIFVPLQVDAEKVLEICALWEKMELIKTFVEKEIVAERAANLLAVEEEPELPGDPPEEIWAILSSGRENAIDLLRAVVDTTKRSIRNRMMKKSYTGIGGENPIRLYRLPDGTMARYDTGKRRLIDPPMGELPEGSVEIKVE